MNLGGISILMVPLVAVTTGLVLVIGLIAVLLRAVGGSSETRRRREDEIEALHRTIDGLEKMEKRIENLETILLSREEKTRAGE
jgi:phage shock protein B